MDIDWIVQIMIKKKKKKLKNDDQEWGKKKPCGCVQSGETHHTDTRKEKDTEGGVKGYQSCFLSSFFSFSE